MVPTNVTVDGIEEECMTSGSTVELRTEEEGDEDTALISAFDDAWLETGEEEELVEEVWAAVEVDPDCPLTDAVFSRHIPLVRV